LNGGENGEELIKANPALDFAGAGWFAVALCDYVGHLVFLLLC
jgi:hypothetical protein